MHSTPSLLAPLLVLTTVVVAQTPSATVPATNAIEPPSTVALQRQAMRLIGAASRQPRRVDTDGRATHRLSHVYPVDTVPLQPSMLLDHDGDTQAVLHYRDAARLGVVGAELVLAHATAIDRPDDALRAMHGLLRAGEERPTTTERARVLLLGLLDHPDDDVAAIASVLLALQIRAGDQAPLPHLRERALAVWPEDQARLVPAAGLAPAPGMAEYSWGGDRVSRLVLLAMHTGDRDLLLRIAAPLPAGATPEDVRRHAHFTLLAASIAAPRVDAATARQLHSWYMPHVQGWDLQTKTLTTWHCGVLAVLTRIHPRLPEPLQQGYGRLRDWPLLRDHVDGQLGGLQRTP